MKKILLIEDEDRLRVNTAEILEISGFQVSTATNGKEGIEQALQTKPDLVVCDIMMPVLDGFGVLQAFNNNDVLAGIPFIFLTAKVERADWRRGMELGADDYLTKPFGINELLAAINSRLQKVAQIKRSVMTPEGLGVFFDQAKQKDGLQSLSIDRKVHLIKKKKVIYTEGDDPFRLYFIKSGKVKIIRENADGKELITALCGPGDFIGYTALIEGRTYTDSAVTLEDTEVLYIPKDDFFSLLYKNADVAKEFVQILTNKIIEKEHQLLGLAYNSLRKRVAEAIVQFAKRFKETNSDAVVVTLTREDLSHVAGTAMESLVRTLADFKNEGLIEMKDGKIVVSKIEKLERLRY